MILFCWLKNPTPDAFRNSTLSTKYEKGRRNYAKNKILKVNIDYLEKKIALKNFNKGILLLFRGVNSRCGNFIETENKTGIA